MKKFRIEDMHRGWFVGNFEPTAFKTKNFEVGYLEHKKGDMWDKHYHKHATEINLIVRGRVKVNDEIYSKGDIFIIEPNETVDAPVIYATGLNDTFWSLYAQGVTGTSGTSPNNIAMFSGDNSNFTVSPGSMLI